MKKIFNINILFLIVLFKFNLLSKDNFKPILNLNYSAKGLPLFEEVVSRDPVNTMQMPNNLSKAEQKELEISEFIQGLNSAKKIRRHELLKDIFESSISVSYFYVDTVKGHLDNVYSYNKIQKKLKNIRNKIIYYGRLLKKETKSKNILARINFHIFLNLYFLNQLDKNIIKNLKSLSKSKYLNYVLKNKLNILIAFHYIGIQNDNNRLNHIRVLKKYIGDKDHKIKVAIYLTIAKAMSGLNAQGHISFKKMIGYNNYLNNAQKYIDKFSDYIKIKILRFSIAIWRKSIGEKYSWHKIPFDTSGYQKTLDMQAIYERQAISLWNKKYYNPALIKMKAISRDLNNIKLEYLIDKRILSMLSSMYIRFKKSPIIEKELLKIKNKYSSSKYSNKLYAKIVQNIDISFFSIYKYIVLNEIKSTLKISSKLPKTQEIANRYLKTNPNKSDYVVVASNLANLYKTYQIYSKAVRLYEILAFKHKDNLKIKYLLYALESQRILTRWPKEPLWKIKKYQKDHLRKLLSIYKAINHSLKKINWNILSHIGLIKIHLDEIKPAFDLWNKILNKHNIDPNAKKAAGFMLNYLVSNKNWTEVEPIAEFYYRKKIIPSYNNKNLNVKYIYGQSLYFHGKKLFLDKNYKLASIKLDLFIRKYKIANYSDDALFHLAISYKFLKKHKLAMRTITNFVENYPNSKFLKQALLIGGSWALPMAYEESAIFFYQYFIKKFKKDSMIKKIMDRVINLFKARGLYDQALIVLRNLLSIQSVNKKFETMLEIMFIEDKYGNKSRAINVANNIISEKFSTHDQKAYAIRVLSVNAYYKRDLKLLNHLYGIINRLNKSSLIVQEIKGEVLYYIVEIQMPKNFENIQNIAIKDPFKSILSYNNKYISIINNYDKICYVGISSYCVLSLYKKINMINELKVFLEDINIVNNKSKKIVDKFKAYKSSIMSNLSNIIKKIEINAKNILKRSQLTPEISKLVLWEMNTKYDMNLIDSGSKKGYIQWKWNLKISN